MKKIAEYLNAQLGYKATVKPDSISEILYRVTVTDHDRGKQLCDLMYKHFKFPYGHSKTARYYEAFDLPIPISTQQAEVGEFNAVCPSTIGGKALWVWGHSMLHFEIAYKKNDRMRLFSAGGKSRPAEQSQNRNRYDRQPQGMETFLEAENISDRSPSNQRGGYSAAQ